MKNLKSFLVEGAEDSFDDLSKELVAHVLDCLEISYSHGFQEGKDSTVYKLSQDTLAAQLSKQIYQGVRKEFAKKSVSKWSVSQAEIKSFATVFSKLCVMSLHIGADSYKNKASEVVEEEGEVTNTTSNEIDWTPHKKKNDCC